MPKRFEIYDFSTFENRKIFLTAVFGDDWKEKAFLVNEPEWGIRRKLEDLDDSKGCYWCVGAIPWGKARKVENVETVRALVLDDVGTKIDAVKLLQNETTSIGIPTAAVGTSAGNFQVVYRFEVPAPPEAFNLFRRWTMSRMSGACDGKDAAHLFRVPWGVNRKPGRNNFAVNGSVLGHIPTIAKLPLTTEEMLAALRLRGAA